MTLIVIMIWGFAALCGLSAVYGLIWAIRTGEMRSFGSGATSIFDGEEPVGRMTDRFPASGSQPPGGGDD